MYCEKFNILFVHIPKTGGQSITQYFLGLEWIPWEQRERYFLRINADPREGPPQTAHFTIDEYYNSDLLPPGVAKGATKFSIVRNPWARLWSEYNFQWKSICSWDDFFDFFPGKIIDDHATGRDALRHIKPQIEFIDEDVQILMFESLKDEFSAFCDQHQLPNLGLPHLNQVSDSVNYRDAYDEKKKAAVAAFYEQDILEFGYGFDQ